MGVCVFLAEEICQKAWIFVLVSASTGDNYETYLSYKHFGSHAEAM